MSTGTIQAIATMKAMVYKGPGQKSWDSVPRPGLTKPTDAIVRITKTTICGTDLHILKGDVPAEILAPKRKRGFATPVSRWFRDRPEETVYPVLRSESCRQRGIFDPDMIERALERHRSGRFDLGNHIFRWISTELWFQEFIDGDRPPLVPVRAARSARESAPAATPTMES